MVGQFRDKHDGAAPTKIIVEPLALVALGIKRSVAPVWNGVSVECREVEPEEVVVPGKGTKLAVVYDPQANQLVAAELV